MVVVVVVFVVVVVVAVVVVVVAVVVVAVCRVGGWVEETGRRQGSTTTCGRPYTRADEWCDDGFDIPARRHWRWV